MKVDVGTMMMVILGLPCLIFTGWFGWHGVTGRCMRFLPGEIPLCGGMLYAFAALFLVAFAALGGLWWLWRD